MATAGGPSPRSRVVLGIDLGTSGVKAVLLDVTTGKRVARGYRDYASTSLVSGAHEQDPTDWWSAGADAVREALASAPDGSAVQAVGLSGHMHSATLVDDAGEPVRPAMTWADRRSTAQTGRLQAYADLFADRCANPIVATFTAPKVAWLAEHEPTALAKALYLVQPKDLLRHRLTGTFGTDVTDARGTLLFDVHRSEWDAALWQLCGADAALGPPVAASADVVGSVTSAAAAATGLPAGTPVVAGASDVACSALGAGAVRTGTVYVNCGTAAQVLAPVDQPTAGRHFVFGSAARVRHLAMSSVYAAGMSVDWVAHTMLRHETNGRSEAGLVADKLGSAVNPGAGPVYLPYLLGTSTPSHDPSVRASFVGLTPEHGTEAVARAVLEGVAYACASAVDDITALAGDVDRVLVGGGLARSSIWSEAMAAVHDVALARVSEDASPLGAALLAGVGVGVWDDVEAATEACVAVSPVRPPAKDAQAAYQRARCRYDAATTAIVALSHDPAFVGETP